MKISKVNSLTYIAEYDFKEPTNILLISDVHFDNPKCNRELFFSHLDKAKKLGYKVAIFGDLFCMMQGKYDPRRSKKDILPEHNKANYIDAVIDDTIEKLKDYSDTIIFVSEGNHETAILKNLETDVLARFVDKYNERYKTNVIKGSYRGWFIVRLYTHNSNEKAFTTYKIYYHHGYGGGGEMTKGILQHSRMNMHIEGADAILMGHVHEMYIQIGQTEYFDSHAYKPKTREIYNIRTACYKDEFTEGGFHIEKGRAPKPLGGILLNVQSTKNKNGDKHVHAEYTLWT
jgi:UDP-2,3-diacylglucosamine pyrophosphatase LpxH